MYYIIEETQTERTSCIDLTTIKICHRVFLQIANRVRQTGLGNEQPLRRLIHGATIGNLDDSLSKEGVEFLGYARQVVEQAELLENRYLDAKPSPAWTQQNAVVKAWHPDSDFPATPPAQQPDVHNRGKFISPFLNVPIKAFLCPKKAWNSSVMHVRLLSRHIHPVHIDSPDLRMHLLQKHNAAWTQQNAVVKAWHPEPMKSYRMSKACAVRSESCI
jgi:hypothetical protein